MTSDDALASPRQVSTARRARPCDRVQPGVVVGARVGHHRAHLIE